MKYNKNLNTKKSLESILINDSNHYGLHHFSEQVGRKNRIIKL
jgi:hypothetical protein